MLAAGGFKILLSPNFHCPLPGGHQTLSQASAEPFLGFIHGSSALPRVCSPDLCLSMHLLRKHLPVPCPFMGFQAEGREEKSVLKAAE